MDSLSLDSLRNADPLTVLIALLVIGQFGTWWGVAVSQFRLSTGWGSLLVTSFLTLATVTVVVAGGFRIRTDLMEWQQRDALFAELHKNLISTLASVKAMDDSLRSTYKDLNDQAKAAQQRLGKLETDTEALAKKSTAISNAVTKAQTKAQSDLNAASTELTTRMKRISDCNAAMNPQGGGQNSYTAMSGVFSRVLPCSEQ